MKLTLFNKHPKLGVLFATMMAWGIAGALITMITMIVVIFQLTGGDVSVLKDTEEPFIRFLLVLLTVFAMSAVVGLVNGTLLMLLLRFRPATVRLMRFSLAMIGLIIVAMFVAVYLVGTETSTSPLLLWVTIGIVGSVPIAIVTSTKDQETA